MKIRLSELDMGKIGTILYVDDDPVSIQRLSEMGFVKGAKVTKTCSSGDMSAYKPVQHCAPVAMRNRTAQSVFVDS